MYGFVTRTSVDNSDARGYNPPLSRRAPTLLTAWFVVMQASTASRSDAPINGSARQYKKTQCDD